MTVFTIDVISDIVCVWCYIGKRHLDRAIARYQKTYPNGRADTFAITWRPYYLAQHPGSGRPSTDKRAAHARKMAEVPQEKVAAMTNRVAQAGAAVGIRFSADGWLANTRDAHRVVDFAQRGAGPAVRDAVVEALFAAFHERGLDIADRGVLRGLAVEAGLDGDAVEAWLGCEENGRAVDAEALANREVVAAGVPRFVINGTHWVDGAQEPAEFMEVFVKIKEGVESQADGAGDVDGFVA